MLLSLVAVAGLASPSSAQPVTHWLSNGTLTVGINVGWGGAITYLSHAGSPNMIDNGFDHTGRSVAVSVWMDGEFGSYWCNNEPWGYNPTQTGNSCQQGSGYLYADPSGWYVGSQPLHWNHRLGRSNLLVDQTLEFVATNALKISYWITNNESFTITGNRRSELPQVYLGTWLDWAFSYEGGAPWTWGPLTDITPPPPTPQEGTHTEPQATERWVAWLSNSIFGVALYVPQSGGHGEYWQTGRIVPQGSTATNIIQRWIVPDVAPGDSYYFEAYLVTGGIDEIRNTIYGLSGH